MMSKKKILSTKDCHSWPRTKIKVVPINKREHCEIKSVPLEDKKKRKKSPRTKHDIESKSKNFEPIKPIHKDETVQICLIKS